MTFVSEILAGFEALAKPQKRFMLAMFSAFFAFRGRANRTNLHRYGAPSPRTQYRQARKDFDFVKFNLNSLKLRNIEGHEQVGVIDESFIKKSGKHTAGIGRFWSGCASRSLRGQSISLIAIADLTDQTAYSVDARQIPSKNSNETQLEFAARHYKETRKSLPDSIKIWLADGAYAKKPFVDCICENDDVLVSKLRKDAAMQHLYRGPRRAGPGRPKKYDGKVIISDINHWIFVNDIDNRTSMFTNRFWHNSLKMEIRVVMLRRFANNKWTHVLLFSTQPEMPPEEVYRLYSSRFQIEFIFRDAKQHTGLEDAQVRDLKSLDFHFNLSLAALNILRLEERERGHSVISIASARRRKQNEDLIFRIFSALDIEPTDPLIQPHLPALIDHGLIAA